MWDQLTTYWPIALVAVGAVWLLYGQRGRLAEAVAWFWAWLGGSAPKPKPAEMTLSERRESCARLRGWLKNAGRIKAMATMDSVLPDLVEDKLP